MRVDDRDTKRTALIGVLCAAACSNAAARGGGGAPAGVDASPGRLVGVGSTPPAAEDCPKALFGVEDSARTIRKDCGPIEVTASYLVDASLTLEAGAVLKFREGAELGVGWSKPARLIVQGTEREPVVLTSAVHDGAWKGLHPHRSAARPEINGLVVENAGGGKGAVVVEAEAVTLRGSTVRNVRGVGIFVDGAGRLADLSGNTFEKAGPVAISVPPDALGGLGPNRFDADAFVQVRGGTVESDARWPSLGAPYVFAENVRIEGKNGRATVEIGAGAELRFRAGVGLDVGGGSDGALVVAGTAERPVVFTAADEPKPGAWRGIGVHGKASVRIAGARFAFAGSDDKGAIRVEGGTAAVTGSAFADDRRALTSTTTARSSASTTTSLVRARIPRSSSSPIRSAASVTATASPAAPASRSRAGRSSARRPGDRRVCPTRSPARPWSTRRRRSRWHPTSTWPSRMARPSRSAITATAR